MFGEFELRLFLQAYSGSVGDSRDVNTWVRVQQADINDPAKYPDLGDQDGIPPLLFALGYGSGVQVSFVRRKV